MLAGPVRRVPAAAATGICRALCLWLVCCGLALTAESGSEAGQAAAAPARRGSAANANAEVFRGVVVPAGKSVVLDSELDYSAVDKVAVTVRCTTCDSQANSMTGLVLQAFWLVPEAEFYSVAESRSSSSFPYWDSGGAVFQVYGSRFRLTLQNKGSQALLIQQVVLFRRAL